jgi:hypothetical protein
MSHAVLRPRSRVVISRDSARSRLQAVSEDDARVSGNGWGDDPTGHRALTVPGAFVFAEGDRKSCPDRVPMAKARLFGTALIYVAFLHGWYSNARSWTAMRGVARANILQDMLAAAVLCIGTARGTLNAMGWGLVAVFAGMTVLNALALRSLLGEPHSDAP